MFSNSWKGLGLFGTSNTFAIGNSNSNANSNNHNANLNNPNANANPNANTINNLKESISSFVNNNKPEVIAGTSGLALAGLGSLFVAGILGGKRKTQKYNNKRNKRKTQKYTNKKNKRKTKKIRRYK